MIKRYIGSLDQGTTSTRFLIFDDRLKVVAGHQMEHAQITPAPGYLEHDPDEIVRNAFACIDTAVDKLRTRVGSNVTLAAIGITNQRETTVAWDRRTGQPLCNAIVWSDLRTEGVVKNVVEMMGMGEPDFLRGVTGLPCSTYFSAMKMKWMLENVAAVREAHESGNVQFGTIDSWLIYNLSGSAKLHVTDCTNASRTMLMNIKSLQWDDKCCSVFGIKGEALPRIVSCSEHIAVAEQPSSVKGVSVSGSIGDQQAALVGQLCFKPGQAKNTYGTGCFLLANVGHIPKPSKHGLLTTVAFKFNNTPPMYALEGSIANAGASIQWLRDRLKVIASAKESETVARSVPDSGGVVFVPAFSGLLAPYWRPDARGVITGITHQTTRAHIVRAALEAIALQVSEVVAAMEKDSGIIFTRLAVDGGMVANRLLMEMQANSLNIPIFVPEMLETTALGAAISAGLAVHVWKDIGEVKKLARYTVTPVKPNESNAARQEHKRQWKEGVKRSLNLSKL